MIPQVNRSKLVKMEVNESSIFREAESTTNVGGQAQSYAGRAGIQVSTEKCFIVYPKANKMVQAVVVTRLPNKIRFTYQGNLSQKSGVQDKVYLSR